MTLPRFLVIDDQYAQDPAERDRFLDHAGLIEEGAGSTENDEDLPLGTAVFCSGQRQDGEHVANDYQVVKSAVDGALGGQGAESWALVLLDVRFDSGALRDETLEGTPGDDTFGEAVHGHLKREFPELPVVMLSGKHQEELEDRGTPYLSKEGLDRRRITDALLRFGTISVEQARRLLHLPKDVVADSPAMLNVFRIALECATTDVSVLLLGESGVGKEVVATFIHRSSDRSKGPFEAVNIAAIPQNLVEDTLFGHEKGAFTDAKNPREGLFELADDGTLFLDEIGDMPLDAQAKVLRAVQERQIRRIGGTKDIFVDLRLVSATSRNIPALIDAGEFREDLFYRINTVPIEIPPLRERREDIPALAGALVERYAGKMGKTGITLSEEALAKLEASDFSANNVRELENVLQRILTSTGNNRVISDEDVGAVLGGRTDGEVIAAVREKTAPAGAATRENAGPVRKVPEQLTDITSLLERVDINPLDPALAGIKPIFEQAFRVFLCRLAGAALERCRDPVSGEINRQRAMQFLTGDRSLKGKGPGRIINQLLGRRQEAPVEPEDLEGLVQVWKEGGENLP